MNTLAVPSYHSDAFVKLSNSYLAVQLNASICRGLFQDIRASKFQDVEFSNSWTVNTVSGLAKEPCSDDDTMK